MVIWSIFSLCRTTAHAEFLNGGLPKSRKDNTLSLKLVRISYRLLLIVSICVTICFVLDHLHENNFSEIFTFFIH